MAEVDRVWYLRKVGEKGSVGPFSTEQLLARWQKGELDRNSEGWREGMLDWRPLLDIEPFTSAARVSLDVTGVIRFYCDCNNEIVMAERFAGRLAKCSVCGREVTVPDPYARFDESQAKEPRRPLPGWLAPAGAVVGLIVIAAAALQLLGVNWMGLGDVPEQVPVDTQIVDDDPTIDADPAGNDSPGESGTTEGPPDSTVAGGDPDDDEPIEDSDTPGPEEQASKTPDEDAGTPDLAAAAKEKANTRADERTVGRLATEYFSAFRSKNPTSLERLEELLADNCAIKRPDGTEITGRTDNLLALAKATARARERYRTMTVRLSIASAKLIEPNAVVTGELVREGQIAGRSRPEKEKFQATIIFTRVEGTWKIVSVESVEVERRSVGAG